MIPKAMWLMMARRGSRQVPRQFRRNSIMTGA